MAAHSKIEWTGATWNPITGCSVISPGCKRCYAMVLAGTRLKNHPSRAGLTQDTAAGPVWTGEVRLNEQWLDQPLRWMAARQIFVCAHGDLFHPNVPDEWIDRVFAVMARSRRHTYQVLTKRPVRMALYISDLEDCAARADTDGAWFRRGFSVPLSGAAIWPLPNVWLGTSVEDQKRANERRWAMDDLADDGWLTWVSYEPALGPVDWSGWEFLDWMVSGAESGHGARHSDPDWHRGARDFCAKADVAFFLKQLYGPNGRAIKTIENFPQDLQIRQWPGGNGGRS